MAEEDLNRIAKKNLEVSEKTLSLIKKMRRDAWFGRFFGVIKWLIILGAAAWFYTQVEPIFTQLIAVWDSAQGVLDNLKNLPGLGN